MFAFNLIKYQWQKSGTFSILHGEMFSLLIDEFENVKSSFLLSGCVVYTRAWREGARTPTSSTTLIKKVVSSLMFACFHVDDDENV